MKKNHDFRTLFLSKTVLTFVAPLVLSIMILGFLSVKNTQSYVRENVHRVNSNILRQTRDTIDAMIDELNIITLNFSISAKAQYGLRRMLQKEFLDYEDIKDLETIQNMLSISHYSRAYIQSIYVYFENTDSRFLTSEMVITSLESFPDKGWYESYRNVSPDRSSWWELRAIPRSGISTGTIPVVTFYKRIYNSTIGGYNGLVVFNVYSDFIRDALNALETFENQTILILDQSNNVISKSNDHHDFLLPGVFSLSPDVTGIRHEGRLFTVSQIESKHSLRYLSVVSNDVLYGLPNYLFNLNLLYILISLLIGTGLSLYFARNSNRQIRTIIEIIRSAKEGKLPNPSVMNRSVKNSYQYILYSIINTFVEQDYLKVQLSEKCTKAAWTSSSPCSRRSIPTFCSTRSRPST